VVEFDLCIQVSPPYRYNPQANFLVVINCAVPSQTILPLINFIQNDLHLQADIFNLSLVGSFTAPDEKHASLLSRYVAKTIVIFANPIAYFQDGTRLPWDLMDPWEACRLASAGTSFLLVYPGDMDHLRKWAWQMALPAFPFPAPLMETLVSKPKEVLAKLAERNRPGAVPDGPFPSLAVKKRIFRSLDSTASSEATSLMQRLNRQFPLQRFLVSPVEDTSTPALGTMVAMSEGLPHKAQAVALLAPEDAAAPTDGLLMAMVVLSIPYADQCRIFWNIVSAGHAAGMNAQSVFGGDKLVHLLGGDSPTKDEGKMIVDPKALEAISWSIAQQITSEISSFCRNTPWPDRTTQKSNATLAELPLLEIFIKTAPTSISPLPEDGLCLLNAVLPPILGVTAPLSVGQWLGQNVIRLGNRRRKVRNMLHRELDGLLQTLYGQQGKAAGKNARKLSSEVKRSLAQIKTESPSFSVVERAHEFCYRRLAQITLVPRGSGFVNLGELSGVERSLSMTSEELAEKRRLHQEHLVQMDKDRVRSEEMLADMVTNA
jgi:hypothetical protein